MFISTISFSIKFNLRFYETSDELRTFISSYSLLLITSRSNPFRRILSEIRVFIVKLLFIFKLIYIYIQVSFTIWCINEYIFVIWLIKWFKYNFLFVIHKIYLLYTISNLLSSYNRCVCISLSHFYFSQKKSGSNV